MMKRKINWMMKRILPCFLVLLMFLSPIYACASERYISDSLNKKSFLSDSGKCVEYKSNTISRSITLKEGDYAVISPFHRVLTNYLSYSLQEVQCSDDSVVSASYYKQSDGKLGLRLHALLEGTADITATYSTYLTRLGLNYLDKRNIKTFTQVIHVTVEATGNVDVKLNISGGNRSSVKGITLSMLTMKDTLSAGELQEIRNYVNGAVDDYYGYADSTAHDLISSGSIMDLVKNLGNTVRENVIRAGQAVGGVISGVVDTLNGVYTTAERVNHAYVYAKYASMKVPVFAPQNLELTVTVTNHTNHTISNISALLKPDRYLSFEGITGPWNTSTTLYGKTLAPEESCTMRIQIYPRFVYGTLSPDGGRTYAYTSNTTAEVSYTDEENGKSGRVQKTIELDAYTAITQEKLDAYKQTLVQEYRAENVDGFTSSLLGGAFNGYKRWFGYDCFSQVFVFACPVDAVIENQAGEELAVLSREGDSYAGDGITGFVFEDAKYVVVRLDAVENYRVYGRATGDGSMDILTWECGTDTGMSLKAYEGLPIAKGDTFRFQTYSDQAADLAAVDASGAETVLEADYLADQEWFLEELKKEGLSEEEAEAYADLLIRSVLPDCLPEDLSAEVKLEDFCALLLNVAENYFGISLSDTEGEEACAVQRAEEFGLLTKEQKEQIGEGSITLEEALVLTDQLLEIMDFSDPGTVVWDWAPIDGEEIGMVTEEEWTGFCRTLGLDRGLRQEGNLQAREAVLLAERLLDYAETAADRNRLIGKICEAYTDSMSWTEEYSSLGLYGNEPDRENSLLYGNFTFWLPGETASASLYGYLGQEIAPFILSISTYITENKEAVEAARAQGYTFCSCPELEGSYMDDDGTVYRWVPVCYMNSEKEIYQDAVYLFVAVIKEGAAEEYIQEYRAEAQGDATMETLLIADQNVTAAFLGSSLQTALFDADLDDYYPELKEGRSGDAVTVLQSELIALGYLSGQADGSYGPGTAAAVSAYQEAKDLEATGTADPHTQAVLYAEKGEAFFTWAQSHYSEEIYESAMEELTRREESGDYVLPANIKGDE